MSDRSVPSGMLPGNAITIMELIDTTVSRNNRITMRETSSASSMLQMRHLGQFLTHTKKVARYTNGVHDISDKYPMWVSVIETFNGIQNGECLFT